MALSSVFWAACLPVFVLVAAAVTEWAGGARAKPSLAIKPDPAFRSDYGFMCNVAVFKGSFSNPSIPGGPRRHHFCDQRGVFGLWPFHQFSGRPVCRFSFLSRRRSQSGPAARGRNPRSRSSPIPLSDRTTALCAMLPFLKAVSAILAYPAAHGGTISAINAECSDYGPFISFLGGLFAGFRSCRGGGHRVGRRREGETLARDQARSRFQIGLRLYVQCCRF